MMIWTLYFDMLELYQEINIFGGRNQTKKTDETAVHVSPSIFGFYYSPLNFERVPNIDGGTCTTKRVLFSSVL